ncbi:MAG: S-adenosylmethionine decarboxylase [Candidatus Peregrinibacteria bacterium]
MVHLPSTGTDSARSLRAAANSTRPGVLNPPTKAEYEQSNAWGLATSADIHGCNPDIIRDADAIKLFTKKLCDKLGMKMFGETVVVDFGDDPRVSGFSLTQLIETSLVSGHFANQTNSVYLDVFSCKHYNAQTIVDFALSFFEGTSFNAHCILRGCDRFPAEYLEKFSKRNIVLNQTALEEKAVCATSAR